MSTQGRFDFMGGEMVGVEQPWIVKLANGAERRVRATSRAGALRAVKGGVSAEPATVAMPWGV